MHPRFAEATFASIAAVLHDGDSRQHVLVSFVARWNGHWRWSQVDGAGMLAGA